ncbi:hypothetical protein Kpol_1057p24 [Vanderwaltozyma polyspora DSM 70294]|uniref:alcohol dehydrogenase (NADP(+)) n=1 Tax=Vanderwaltozyma polyspora (strain ATCC 22028 / DSM 70294 / BCRC 21397 / CBS 2163 / NBRC 10782 / NRRL Y-8283 / UCD 57-17) TaxID=436907 RepID=A7TPJ1_VANPO|nr:uncharacterized protein Kpol_1057p24 [Vanderwaltozyma polyspora DSM 70294]EDO15835.1 hypothetical protein Kpol_1057p24 [Vanderwaltozyma polyspora DSM 70294]
MSYPEKFQGIGITNREDWKHPKKVTFEPKQFNDKDVDIKIEACGVCGSDVHCAASHWGPVAEKQVVGHEIIGRVLKVGPKCTTGIKVGDRVGVGAQAWSCLECSRCKSDNESYCPKSVWTYSIPYIDGYVSQGGYASHIRLHEHFAIPIPDKLSNELAAPLLCGGITVYSPLLRNGCGPGKKVGIVGIGGIGHMGLLFAKGMGAEVYAFSRTHSKEADAKKLGADHFIATLEDKDWTTKYFDTLDLLVICASSLTDINFDELTKIMKVNTKIISISAPAADEVLTLKPFGLIGVTIGNSAIGSRREIEHLLNFVAEKDIKPWVETLPVGEAGVNEAFERMDKGDVKYRFTLVDFDKEFGN